MGQCPRRGYIIRWFETVIAAVYLDCYLHIYVFWREVDWPYFPVERRRGGLEFVECGLELRVGCEVGFKEDSRNITRL